MPKIRKLSENVIPKIAAGEVVERPASVIKELLDNAIDAGATRITVEIEDAGLKKIKVIDDGEGMLPEDLKLCLLHHSTSKILTENDLSAIRTLGFRGEALSSIAAVSKFVIKSRPIGLDSGYEIHTSSGHVLSEKSVGMSSGTVVEVSQLFHNVPARKKFLKTKQTEYRRIIDVLTSYVLANPGIGFRFSRDDKVVFDISAASSIWERIQELLGVDLSMSLLHFETESERIVVKGYLSKPQVSSKSREHQFLFINGRVVENKVVSSAIKDAYGKNIEPKSFPPFVLYLELDPALVDANVHPRKEQVSFWDEEYVYEFVYESVKEFLTSQDLTYVNDDRSSFGINLKAASYTFAKLKEAVVPWDVDTAEEDANLLQISKTYLVTSHKGGLLLLDQHAAHEAILFNQFLEEYEKQSEHTIELKNPVILDVSIAQAVTLQENSEVLSHLGFTIELFGRNSFRVSRVPNLIREHNIKKVLDELLVELQKSKKITKVDELSRRTIAFLACRSAIKAGDSLSEKQRRELLEKLDDIGEYTCPHGRPAKVIITKSELERMFKRN